MSNIFDQFDEAPATQQTRNLFDQFDAPSDATDNTVDDFMQGTGAFGDSEGATPQGRPDPAAARPQAEGFSLNLPDVPFLPEQYQDTVKSAVESGVAGPTSTSFGRAAATGAAHNAPRNLTRTGLALTDVVTGSETLPAFDERVPAFEPESGLEELAAVFGEIGAGVAGGALGVRAVIDRAAPAATQVFRNMGTLIGGEAGMAAAIDEDTGTVITGDDSLAKIIPGLALDRDGNYSEEALKKRFNIMLDSMAMVPSLAWITQQGGNVAGFLYAITGGKLAQLGSKSAREETIVREYIQELSNIPVDASPQETADAIRRLADRAEENSEVFIQMGRDGIDDIAVRRDTMSSLEMTAETPEEISRLRGVRHHMEQRGGSELESTLAQPSLETDRVLQQSREVFGGDQSMTAAREGIQESGIRQERALRDEILARENLRIDTEEGLQTLLREDPTFGNLLERLSDASGTMLPRQALETGENLIGQLRKISQDMTKVRNEKYAAIPDDAPVNADALAAKLDELNLPDEIVDSLIQASDDYKTLLEFSNFDLSRAINQFKREQDWDTVRDLQSLRRHIDQDQLDHLIISGDRQTRDAAQEAKRYHAEEYAPFWRDGVLEDIQRLDRDFMGSPISQTEAELPRLRQTLSGGEEQIRNVENIHRVLEQGGGDTTALGDYALAQVLPDLEQVFRREGKFTPEAVEQASSRLRNFIAAMEEVDPAQARRLTEFMDNVRERRFTVEELSADIKRMSENLSSEQQRLFGSELAPFFRQEGREFLPRSNTNQIFREVLDDPDALDKIPGLMRRTEEASKGRGPWDPDAVDGMKAAYSDWLNQKVFRRGQEGRAGERMVSPLSADDIQDVISKGRLIYQDSPEVIDGIERVLTLAVETQAKRGPGKTFVMDLTEALKGSRGAVDFLTTQIFGVLNRLGARVRSAAGRGISAIDPTDSIRNSMDVILSNPEEFARIARSIADKEGRRTTPEQKKQIYRMLVRTGLYKEHSEEDFINTLSEIEREINEGLSGTDTPQEETPSNPDQRSSLDLDEQTMANLTIDELIESDDLDQVPWFFKEPSNAKQDRLPANQGGRNARFGPESEQFEDYSAFTLMNWTPETLDKLQDEMNLSKEETERLAEILNKDAKETNLAHERGRADRQVAENRQRGPQYPQQR